MAPSVALPSRSGPRSRKTAFSYPLTTSPKSQRSLCSQSSSLITIDSAAKASRLPPVSKSLKTNQASHVPGIKSPIQKQPPSINMILPVLSKEKPILTLMQPKPTTPPIIPLLIHPLRPHLFHNHPILTLLPPSRRRHTQRSTRSSGSRPEARPWRGSR